MQGDEIGEGTRGDAGNDVVRHVAIKCSELLCGLSIVHDAQCLKEQVERRVWHVKQRSVDVGKLIVRHIPARHT